jgi:hypothetical protein
MLNRDVILAADDLPRREVQVPEWGGSVYVRALNGAERDQLERMVSSDSISRAALVALCTVDEAGERMFSDKDVAALAQKNGAALGRIVTAAMDANAITDEAIGELGKAD